LPASQGFLLAIDLGTTACKASLFTLDGWRVGICRASIRLYSPEPSAAEQEPDEWRAALELSLRQLSQQYPEAIQTVVGIGLAAQMNALVLMDSQNNPMGRVQSAMDQRAVPYSTRLRAEYASDFPDIYFGRSTSLGRIAWLRDQRPQLFENCAHISDACGLLSYWLTGTFASDASIGVWRWTPELAAILGVPLNMLPEIRMPWEITGRLLPEFARRAGLPAGIPVVAGSGDGPCTNIGAGALRLSESCVTLGTTGVVRVVLPSPLPVHVSTPIFSYPFINGLWLGGGYYPAGACLQWLRNLLEAGGPPQSEWDWLQRYLNQPDYQAKLQQCIHCGLCLQACPTYMLLGTEMDSPRGRISLIRAASEGRIDFAGAFQEHIQLCLACRACESACPSGVQYGSLVEMARISIEERRQPDLFERVVRWLALRQLMPRLPRLKSIARLARLYQSLGLSALVHRMAFLPQRLKTTEGLLPPMPQHYADYRQPAPALGIQHGRVAFFYGCIQEAFLAQVNQATIRVLQTNDYEVHFPTAQTCCGAAQLHLG
jgi:sugar (pentulose or hexulose) kinase